MRSILDLVWDSSPGQVKPHLESKEVHDTRLLSHRITGNIFAKASLDGLGSGHNEDIVLLARAPATDSGL